MCLPLRSWLPRRCACPCLPVSWHAMLPSRWRVELPPLLLLVRSTSEGCLVEGRVLLQQHAADGAAAPGSAFRVSRSWHAWGLSLRRMVGGHGSHAG
jgi:hypothetical protein